MASSSTYQRTNSDKWLSKIFISQKLWEPGNNFAFRRVCCVGLKFKNFFSRLVLRSKSGSVWTFDFDLLSVQTKNTWSTNWNLWKREKYWGPKGWKCGKTEARDGNSMKSERFKIIPRIISLVRLPLIADKLYIVLQFSINNTRKTNIHDWNM